MTDNIADATQRAGSVKALVYEKPHGCETLTKAETLLGEATVWTHHEANGDWFWKLGKIASGTEANEADAKKMLWATYEARVLSALSSAPAPAPAVVTEPVAEGAAVAWQVIIPGFGPGYFHTRAEVDHQLAQEGCAQSVVTPLFAHPPATEARIAELTKERDEARAGWLDAETRLSDEIDAGKSAWAKHGGMEMAKGQWEARAIAAEAEIASLSQIAAIAIAERDKARGALEEAAESQKQIAKTVGEMLFIELVDLGVDPEVIAKATENAADKSDAALRARAKGENDGN